MYLTELLQCKNEKYFFETLRCNKITLQWHMCIIKIFFGGEGVVGVESLRDLSKAS